MLMQQEKNNLSLLYNMNIGHISNLIYDEDAYNDRVSESTSSATYRLSSFNNFNCDGCLSVGGPRARNGVSSTTGHVATESQKLTDIESILSNRNVKASKSKDGKVNPIDVTKYDVKHARICGKELDPISSRLTHPSQNYRGIMTSRFYDLPKNPQAHIYWNTSANTRLETRDNYRAQLPKPQDSSNQF